MKKLTLGILVAIASFSISALELTAQPAGTITFSVGLVEMKAGQKWVKVKAGRALSQADIIRTGNKSTAILNLNDGASVKLRANSQIVLTSISGAGKTANITLDLERGSTFASVLKRNQENSFKIRAMTVTAGVRGTEFFVATGEKIRQNKDPEVMMCVKEGTIYVTSSTDQREININAGEGVVFKPQTKIPTPEKLPWINDLNWNMDAKAGEVKDSTSLKDVYKSQYKDKLNQNYD